MGVLRLNLRAILEGVTGLKRMILYTTRFNIVHIES